MTSLALLALLVLTWAMGSVAIYQFAEAQKWRRLAQERHDLLQHFVAENRALYDQLIAQHTVSVLGRNHRPQGRA